MNKIKVEHVVEIFCDSVGIASSNYRSVIKELMEKIITHYEANGVRAVEDEQEYLIKNSNNKYSIEDFFLNRLLFNVRAFTRKNSGGRACYADDRKEIELNFNKLSTLLDGFNGKVFTDEQKYLAAKKVVMHEFEHALQTKFEKGPAINDFSHYQELYKKLKNSGLKLQLNEIYDGRNLLPYRGSGNRIQSGVMGNSRSDKYRNYQGTFYLRREDPNYYGENNVNEILNESESLVMSGSNQQDKKTFPSDTRIHIRNNESSNYLITNYGFMLKMLFGAENTFKGMYVDRNLIIDYFNQNYGDIFEQVFAEHFKNKFPGLNRYDGWALLHMAINCAKYSDEKDSLQYCEKYHLKLNLALSLCFDRMMKERMMLGEEIDKIKEQWNEFASLTMYHPDKEKMKQLPHAQVLYSLKDYVIKQNLVNNNSFSQYVQPGLK